MIWLLVGYMWLFIHRPFEVWPWIGELRVERVYMLATIGWWFFFSPKTLRAGRSTYPVLLMAATFLIASQTSPYASFNTVEDWFKIFVFYVLLVTSIHSERDLKTLVIAFVAIMSLYELHSFREFLCGRCKYEMGTTRMIGVDVTLSHPNSFGASVVYALPWLYPVWTVAHARWQKLSLIAAAILATTCVLLTGSRTSFIGLLALAVVGSLVSRYRWRVLPLVLVLPALVWVNLRPDLQDRYMSLVDPSRGVGSAEASAEFRETSFWDGMRSFAENPLTGAGLGSYFARTGFETHNLYNSALGELGVLGLVILVGFAWSFGADFLEARQLNRGRGEGKDPFLYHVCIAATASCVMLFFLGMGGHNLDRYNWLWFGAFSSQAVSFLREHGENDVQNIRS